jgi:hypothetical protein
MNAFEIAEAVSKMAGEPFDAANFPFAFLEAFGNKDATIARLRNGSSNGSDVPGAVLQRSNIHLGVSANGETPAMLDALKASPATKKQKAKFILATDGEVLEAEDLASGETMACEYQKIENHFGFFLPLAGITTVKQIHNNPVDIQATGRLNRLYIELLSENPDWGTAARRQDLNQFMARLIFCFFAEDTDIFHGDQLFSSTVAQMSDPRSGNTHEVILEIFRAMDVPTTHEGRPDPRYRMAANIKPWADFFPYVNGGLFTNIKDVPKFNRIARAHFLHAGKLDWKLINPDIFGSMIQAVADDEERGELGMHYTSVPNILKVLNPLFLDDLREQLEAAGNNARSLLNLRKRMARIRVFDPACGSGNFLVIAYKEMRKLEAEINERRGEQAQGSEIPLTNFRGIELRGFAAEIARLALIIAEFQCDVLYRGQKDALLEFLPLDAMNWITCANALQLDWLSICPPTGDAVKFAADDLFHTPLDQAQIDFENQGGETYICGNPPYKGTKNQSKEQKFDLENLLGRKTKNFKSLDYVAGWFYKAAEFGKRTPTATAFVSTNSICQGGQVPVLWPLMYEAGARIRFAYTSFKWSNLASNNAGVTVIIVGFSSMPSQKKTLYVEDENGVFHARVVPNINSYLIPSNEVIVEKSPSASPCLGAMDLGNAPYEGGNLLLSNEDLSHLALTDKEKERFIRKVLGSDEFINGLQRFCIWIEDAALDQALNCKSLADRIELVKKMRLSSKDVGTNSMANRPHQFREMYYGKKTTIIVPIRSSEKRYYLPVGLLDSNCRVTNLAYALYDEPIYNIAVVACRLHLVWIAAVCGKLETRFSYSNKMGWNTFPLPTLTEKNKADLTECAENILLARESHWPATIAELYDPETMPENLRAAHERNDEVLERIYIGRRFKNDTERLEKLFELYTKMTTNVNNDQGKTTRNKKAKTA